MTTHHDTARTALTALLLLALPACGDDVGSAGGTDADSASGFAEDDDADTPGTTPGSADGSTGGDDSNPSGGPGDGSGQNPGTDDGEPPGPGEDAELCDAGDEAFVKRLIPFTQGRKPDSVREVRLLVSMIEQLDMQGEDGRRAVTLGLLRGDAYYNRFKDYLYEELRVNLSGDRRNETCYDLEGSEGDSAALAAFIRDNPVTAQYDGDGLWWMPDVAYSTLRLDDMSPMLRADLFARTSAPFIAGNVTEAELEEMRLNHFGRLFESTMMGRSTDCLECHRAEESVTDAVDPEFDRHWPVPGFLELGAYARDADNENITTQSAYAIFRYQGFAEPQSDILAGTVPNAAFQPFGMGPSCGAIIADPGPAPLLDWQGYLMGEHAAGDTLVDLDEEIRAGFDALRNGGGLEIAADNSVAPDMSGAYLMSMHMANRMWTHGMGFPLQVANGFPRNDAQRQIIQELTDSFVANGFSLRNLIADVATHPYFNQSPPDSCASATAYIMPAVFDPFAKESSDPAMRANGVGDTVHRYGARVLLDSIAQAMWWNTPDVFGPGTNEIPGAFGNQNGCGANMPDVPCVDGPDDAQVLRDLGSFLSDSDPGFSGTDLLVLLRLENDFGQGVDPGMHGDCTGPLGAPCAADDWITQLIDVAASAPEADMWSVAAAVKDRMITDPSIRTAAEVAALEELMDVTLTDTVADVGAGTAEQAARRLAGMLTNTPQFMMAGIPSKGIDESDDPTLVVPGTTTEDLCQYLAPSILDNGQDGIDVGYTCSASGITLE